VTSAITPPVSSGILAGLSTAFSTGASNRLAEGAVLQDVSALHVGINMRSAVSVSTQITALRKLLLGGTKGDLGSQVEKVLRVSHLSAGNVTFDGVMLFYPSLTG
jgi:hypothetical protein